MDPYELIGMLLNFRFAKIVRKIKLEKLEKKFWVPIFYFCIGFEEVICIKLTKNFPQNDNNHNSAENLINNIPKYFL